MLAAITINVIGILVIVVLASLAWWVNEQVNKLPVLSKIVRIIIVVVAVLALLYSLGMISGPAVTVR